MVTAINNNVNVQGQMPVGGVKPAAAQQPNKTGPIDFSAANSASNSNAAATAAGAPASNPAAAPAPAAAPKNKGKGFFAGISEKWTKLKNAMFKKSKTAAPAAGGTANAASTSKDAGKIASKIKGKGGKIGIIAALGAALFAGGVWLYNKLTGDKKTENVQNEDAAVTQENSQDAVSDKDETNVGKQPVADASEDNEDKKVSEDKDDDKKSEQAEVETEHTVVKGDNMWNIAKQHLKDLKNDPDYKPTNAEIAKHTKELIELNGLKYEPDGYVVIIRPDDVIKLA